MKRRRVKITGIGPVTPAGIGREEFTKGIFEGKSRIRKFRGLDDDLGPFVAAYISDFKVGRYFADATLLKNAARHTLFAAVGAKLALADAAISVAEANRLNPTFVAGVCVMDFDGICRTIDSVVNRGARGAISRTIFTTNAACVPAVAAQSLELSARTITVQSSCASGLDAIGHAARMIAEGEADLALCGGTDAPLIRCPLVELRAAGMTPATTERAEYINRPFDLWRTTGVISEGASMFVLEPESSPRPAYSYIDGYAFANDAPDDLCGGMVDAMKLALAEAKLRSSDIDCINAWGPGHKLIDAAEARALRVVFGDKVSEIPAFSIKGAVGSALAGAPAIQVAATAIGHRTGEIPPTVNWEFPDPDCPLNLSNRARAVTPSTVLVNAHGLSGVNSSLVMTR